LDPLVESPGLTDLDNLLVPAHQMVVLTAQVDDQSQAAGDPVGEPAQPAQGLLRGAVQRFVGHQDAGQAGLVDLPEQPPPEPPAELLRRGGLLPVPAGNVVERVLGLDEQPEPRVPGVPGRLGVEVPELGQPGPVPVQEVLDRRRAGLARADVQHKIHGVRRWRGRTWHGRIFRRRRARLPCP
jgi:hypothetical protein